MSTNLYWRPHSPTKGHDLPYELKSKLGRLLWDHDGSLSGQPTALGRDSYVYHDGVRVDVISYLRGLKDAGIRGAKDLLEVIDQHGTVEVEIR
jgi:hypothetical protein